MTKRRGSVALLKRHSRINKIRTNIPIGWPRQYMTTELFSDRARRPSNNARLEVDEKKNRNEPQWTKQKRPNPPPNR